VRHPGVGGEVGDAGGEGVGGADVAEGGGRGGDALAGPADGLCDGAGGADAFGVEGDQQFALVEREAGQGDLDLVGPAVAGQFAGDVPQEGRRAVGVARDVEGAGALQVQQEVATGAGADGDQGG
jgi:hypothetical protein